MLPNACDGERRVRISQIVECAPTPRVLNDDNNFEGGEKSGAAAACLFDVFMIRCCLPRSGGMDDKQVTKSPHARRRRWHSPETDSERQLSATEVLQVLRRTNEDGSTAWLERKRTGRRSSSGCSSRSGGSMDGARARARRLSRVNRARGSWAHPEELRSQMQQEEVSPRRRTTIDAITAPTEMLRRLCTSSDDSDADRRTWTSIVAEKCKQSIVAPIFNLGSTETGRPSACDSPNEQLHVENNTAMSADESESDNRSEAILVYPPRVNVKNAIAPRPDAPQGLKMAEPTEQKLRGMVDEVARMKSELVALQSRNAERKATQGQR